MMESLHCPRCGRPLPAGILEGLCPKCLLQQAAPSGTSNQPDSASQRDWQPPSMEELARHFEELEILGIIGRGGMGAVYKVRQKSLDRLAALKILPARIADSPEFSLRFARESQALARLSHPHIVAVYDSGHRQDLFFFLMEYVDGPNLRQLLHDGRLAPEQALAIVPQICQALQHAHDQGIVHRDIKPENILLNRQGQVKIADFGLVKLMGPTAQELTLTQNRIMGTPVYMAPEQIEHPDQVDHRADIYSLGVVFYQMLTGELPMGKFAPPSRKVQIDVRLDDVVLRTLEKERERRYQQASEVRTDVETIIDEPAAKSGLIAQNPDTPSESESQTPKRFRFVWVLWLLVILLGLFLVSVLLHLSDAMQQEAISNRPTISAPSAPGRPFFLPDDWKSIQSMERVNNDVYVGGIGADRHGRFGSLDTTSGTFTNLSSSLPASYAALKSFAFGDGHLLVAADKVGQIFWGQLGDFAPDSQAFHDLTDSMHAPFPYNWSVNAMVFDGTNFLIAGAGQATGLALYSPRTQWFTPLAEEIPYYFATNSIVRCGNSSLLVGAGAYRPGSATPPALGWITFNGAFRDLKPAIPPGLGAMFSSAFNGRQVLIQGFSTYTGRQMIELFDPSTNAFTDVSNVISSFIVLHRIAAIDGRFILSGQAYGKAYLAIFDPVEKTVTTIDDAVPSDAVDITALNISADHTAVGGVDSKGRIFIDLPHSTMLGSTSSRQ